MSKTPQNNSSETRRRLLKSVLGASTVVTLGYGGNAAAASISCVAKVRDLASGGPPAGTAQFTMIEPQPTLGKTNWGWLRVDVRKYRLATGSAFEAFEAGGKIYKTSAPDVEVVGASLAKNQNGYPKDAWVLAYFDDSGALVSTYPSEQLAEPGATPAAQSCLASVNPGAVGNFTFGG